MLKTEWITNPESKYLDENNPAIQKVGAAIIKNAHILVVKKIAQPTPEYFLPGGKIERNETQIQTLTRELDEELCISVEQHHYIGTFHDIAVFEKVPIIIHCYIVPLDTTPTPTNEIKEYRWLPKHYDRSIPLSSILANGVIPHLIQQSIL